MNVRAKLWNRHEYDQLVASGGLQAEARVQLIRGEIVEMTPQGAGHATAILLTQREMSRIFSRGFVIRIQLPLALGEWSEPEPDVAVVRGSIADHREHHPDSAALVVEVADATLEFDRARKQQVYAEAAIPEYWIVNLIDRVLEVYRDPQGAAYRSNLQFNEDEVVSPLAASGSHLSVSDLLP